jgi:hypothetical protein
MAAEAWGPRHSRKTIVEQERRHAIHKLFRVDSRTLARVVRRQVMWDALVDEVVSHGARDLDILKLHIRRKEFVRSTDDGKHFARRCDAVLVRFSRLWTLGIEHRPWWLRVVGQLRTSNVPLRPPHKVPPGVVERVRRLEEEKQFRRRGDLAQAVGLSPATISRILRSRGSLYDVEPTVPSNYCEVTGVARIQGERRFKVGWVSGPTPRELNRTYPRPRRRPRCG